MTAGTIFHRIRTPLSTWFAAIWFITSQKNGVSALGLQRVLGFGSYETAWAWMHKLRRAMVRPERDRLSGVVELDEVFIGNETRRWLTGTLHYAVSQEHLGYYLDEYTFRFNHRTSKARGLLFYRLLQQAVETDPHRLALRNTHQDQAT